jgi:hypothetical protein
MAGLPELADNADRSVGERLFGRSDVLSVEVAVASCPAVTCVKSPQAILALPRTRDG